ncbi:MAG: hypothetical protein GF346_08905, partial [Candidatus Eisenbacteria bacterium]|nr:hypothetical protein [Candidatus Latescibacterota bacterium]MBD3302552.1 hypothetical protein [Candidatus Eisenbacteria bacterium]
YAARLVRVSVRFTPGPAPETGRPIMRDDPSWERVYRSALLNAEAAASWARGAPARPRPRPKTLQTTDLVKLDVLESGLRRVTFEDLADAGWDGEGRPISALRLFERFYDSDDAAEPPQSEVDVPIRIEDGDASGDWSEGDAFVFYGENLYDRLPDLPMYLRRYGRRHVYWLGLRDGAANARMEETSSWLGAELTPVESFPWTIRWEKEVRAYGKVGAGSGSRLIDHERDLRSGVLSVRTKHTYWQGGNPYDIDSGLNWFSVPFDLPGFVAPRGLAARFQGILRPGGGLHTHRIHLFLSETAEADTSLGVRLPRTPVVAAQQDSALYVADAADLAGTPLREEDNHFIHFELNDGYGAALHWFEVSYSREPKFDDGTAQIGTGTAVGPTEYRLPRPPADGFLGVEFTDPRAPRLLSIDPDVQIEGSGPRAQLKLQWDLDGSPRRFWLAEPEEIPAPDRIARDVPSDLAGPGDEDYVVIVPREWIPNLQEWIGHRESEAGGGHRILVAPIEDVYDEFSGGRRWPHAIRSFLRTLFRTRAVPPAYLLLVGDATDAFDNDLVSSDPNWVPTQTMFSNSYTSYQGPELIASDQWFVDDLVGTGEALDFLPDMHVGRISAGDVDQLEAALDKTIRYETFEPDEQWRNRVLFIADDAWSSTISFDSPYQYKTSEEIFRRACVLSEELIEEEGRLVDFGVDSFYVYAYMDSVPELGRCVIDPETGRCAFDDDGWVIYNPDPPQDAWLTNLNYGTESVAPLLWQQMNRGYLFVSYNGHANARLMTHEYVFRHSEGTSRLDVDRLANSDRPFVFMGYGCHLAEFSASDEANYGRADGISENMLFSPAAAGVGAIASTGYEWLHLSDRYNLAVVEAFFANPPQQDGKTRWVLGEIVSRSKANIVAVGGGNSDTYFSMSATYSLLGDPGLRMDAAPPRLSVRLDGEPVETGAPLVLPAGEDSVLFEVDVRDEIWARSFSVEDIGGTVPPDRYTVEADSADDRSLTVRYRTTVYPQNYDVVLSAEDGNGRVALATFPVRVGVDFEIRREGDDWTGLQEGDLVQETDSVRVSFEAPRHLAEEDLTLRVDGDALPVRAEPAGSIEGDRSDRWLLTALQPITRQGDRTIRLSVRQPDGSTVAFERAIGTEEVFEIQS